MRLRRGESRASGVPWGDGFGKGAWEGWRGQLQTGLSTRSGVRHPSAARTSLLSLRAMAELRAYPNRAAAVLRRAILSAYWDSLLGDPIERGLASTSRGKRRRIGRELQMAEHLADHLGLRDGGDHPQRPLMAKRADSYIQSKHPLEQPRPAPVWRGMAGLRLFHALLAWCRGDRAAQAAVRRQTASIPHQVDPRQGHQCCQLLQEFQWRESDPSRAVCPGLCEGIHEIPVGVLCKTLKSYCTAGRIAEQVL